MSAVVVETVTIRAAPERVFAYRLDVTRLPEYNPDVLGLRALTNGSPSDGSRYRFRLRLLPWVSLPTTLTISEVLAPTRLVFEIASLMSAREVCTFEASGDGTRVRFETTVKTPRGPVGRLIDRAFVVPNARRQLRVELARMKERLEKPDRATLSSDLPAS
jgi:hypothetical protein